MQIQTKVLEHQLFVMKVLYLFGRPLDMYVPVIHSQARLHGYKIMDSYVFEHKAKFGWGWFGVAVQAPTKASDLIELKGEFKVVVHQGDYADIPRTFQEIKKTYPKVDDFLVLYLNDPLVTPVKDLETEILFVS